mmetsp:Transcript_3993/g.14199  ORF Transcript_3993/g.14199 Transcript_3993/m.14199 type:complete len:143 (+) Transcript_3993:1527-1955(+)
MLRSSILYKDKLQYKSGFSETQALASEQLCILADTYKHLVLVTPRRVLPRHTLTGSQSFLHTLEQFTPTSRSDCRKVEHLVLVFCKDFNVRLQEAAQPFSGDFQILLQEAEEILFLAVISLKRSHKLEAWRIRTRTSSLLTK